MQHNLCECGHDKKIHGRISTIHETSTGEFCTGCDCSKFVQLKAYRDRKPRLSTMLRRLARRFDMNR